MASSRQHGRVPPPDPDGIIHDVAATQLGVVARAQLVERGISAETIDRRVRSGRLRPVHRGVYLVGPVVDPRALEMAGVLACGPTAVVSHRSAARLWKILRRGDRPIDRKGRQGRDRPVDTKAPRGRDRSIVDKVRPGRDRPIDITVRDGVHRSRTGLRIHRTTTLADGEITDLVGLPVTTPARTLYDLAGCEAGRDVERAVAEAFALRLTSPSAIRTLMERHPDRRGSAVLRALLRAGDPAFTRSEAEERFLSLVRKARIAEPEVNVRVADYEVDFLWRREGVAAEVDGFAFHSSRRAFDRDRARDADLLALGFPVMRVTWEQLDKEPEAVVARLVRALMTGGAVERVGGRERLGGERRVGGGGRVRDGGRVRGGGRVRDGGRADGAGRFDGGSRPADGDRVGGAVSGPRRRP